MFHLLSATTAAERMAALGEFIEHWYGPRRPEFGETAAHLARPELPDSLRRFYAFAGRWPCQNEYSDEEFFYTGESGHHLLPLDSVQLGRDGRLTFFMEYQGDWYGETTPGEADPPVWIRGRWNDFEPGEGVRQVSAALSRFLVTHTLMTTLYDSNNAPHPRTSSGSVDKKLAAWARAEAAAAELLWEAEPNGCPNYDGSFHLVRGRVLVHGLGSDAPKVGTNHPDGLAILRAVLGDAA